MSDCRAASKSFSIVPRDIGPRKDAPEVRDVAVLVVRIVLVFQPLLQLPVAADVVRGDLLAGLVELGGEVGVPAQRAGGRGRVGEQAADDLVVHRRAHHQPALLRRVRRPADQVAGERVFDEIIEEELRRPFHGRIGFFGQELLIAREQVLFPKMLAEPGPAGDPDAVVGGVDGGRARQRSKLWCVTQPRAPYCSLATDRAGMRQVGNRVVQRRLAFGQVRRQRGPVVHLRIDVAGVLAVPGRVERIVPDALQIGRLPALAAGGNQQIAAVLEEQRGQVGVVAVAEVAEADVGGFVGGGRVAEVERDAVEEALVVVQKRM